jgi:hypothetical protein
MRWSTGFFRLWIVLMVTWMVTWMVTVFAGMGKDQFKALWAPKAVLEVSYKGEVYDTLDSGKHDPDFLRLQIIEDIKRGATLLQRTDPAEAKKQIDSANSSADELLKTLSDENQARVDRLHTGLLFLLAPPVTLLILGVAIGWIASGFRKGRQI